MKIVVVILCFLPCLLALRKGTVTFSPIAAKKMKTTAIVTDTIDIDNFEPELQQIHMSGDRGSTDDGDDDDDDDDLFMSGDGTTTTIFTPSLTPCQIRRKETSEKKLIGSFIPRCTLEGHYAPVQCHSGTGECWCVEKNGSEKPYSRKRTEMPNCNNIEKPPVIVVPTRRPPGSRISEETSTQATNLVRKPLTMTTEAHSDDGFTLIPAAHEPKEPDNKLDPLPNEPSVDVGPVDMDSNEINQRPLPEPRSYKMPRSSIINQPGILAGIIGGAVVGLICAVLLVMFIVYHMRKKEETVFMNDRPTRSPSKSGYTKAAFDKDIYT